MSVYNSNESNTFKESHATFRSRIKVKSMCKYGFKERGYKLIKILDEVPATFNKKYHGDFGVLLTTPDYETQYFFIIEIDGKVGHGTPITSYKENERDELFKQKTGAITLRLPLQDLVELDCGAALEVYFASKIWNPFFFNYLQPARSPDMEMLQIVNKEFAMYIANNNFTSCGVCPHPNYDHDLGGCSYQWAVDEKKKCNCDRAFLRSNK